MKEFFENKVNLFLVGLLVIAALVVTVPSMMKSCTTKTADSNIAVTNPTEPEITDPTQPTTVKPEAVDKKAKVEEQQTETKPTEEATEAPTEKATEKATTSATSPTQFATAAPVRNKASHQEQWDEGYLVAIDGPDTDYGTEHIELTDENRELLERLCMAEASDDFYGAALVAQSVKDAMYSFGLEDVQDVIDNLHHTENLASGSSENVKKAVYFIFDMDRSAIQHRILYLYNPKKAANGFSKYHESRRYVCTYNDIRFFDQ